MDTEKKRRFIINVLFYTCLFGLLYLIFKYLLVWLMPFVIGFFAAVLLQKPIAAVVRLTHWKRSVVSPLLTFLLVVVVGLGISALIYNGVGEIASLIARIPELYQNTVPMVLESISAWSDRIFANLSGELETTIRSMISDVAVSLQNWLVEFASKAMSWLAARATMVPQLLIAVIISIVACFYMTSGFESIKIFLRRQVPAKYRQSLSTAWHTFGQTVGKMLTSYALIMFITFCELSIGLVIYRVNYAVLLAAIISVVDILPVLGVGTVLIPWGVVLLILGDTWMGIKILALYGVITVVRNFLEPRIIGGRIGLSPLITLIFMYLGLKVMGVLGMFLFPLSLILLSDAQRTGVLHLWKNAEDDPPKGADS